MLFLFDCHDNSLVYADEDAEKVFDTSEGIRLPESVSLRLSEVEPELLVNSAELNLKMRQPVLETVSFRCSLVATNHRRFVRVEGPVNRSPSLPDHGSFLDNVYESVFARSKSSQGQNRLLIGEKTIATIFDAAVDAIVIINEQGLILGFNSSAEKIFKIPAEDAIGKDVNILMPEPHKSKHKDYVRRYLETGIPHIVGIGRKVEAMRSDGSLFPIDLAVAEVKLESGSIFAGFIRDLSESIRLESERDSFFQMSLDMFCILTPEGLIKNANPSWFSVLGYTPEEIHSRSLSEFFHRDEKNNGSKLLDEILRSDKIVGRTFRFRNSDGDFRWLLWNSARDRKNNVIYAVARDITEQRGLLEELETARREAQRSSDARGMFIAKMSHELRTPLNSIIGFSGILQKNQAGNFSEKDLLYLDRIKRNGTTLLRLINSILEFSRTESGFQEVNLEEVKINELVKEVVDLMQVTVEQKKVELFLEMPENCAALRTDQIKTRQIIQNLIDNAVKFSDSGNVKIVLNINLFDNKPVRLDIHDSGPGIPQADLEMIFEAFQQCDNSVTRRFGGAGLGLAIARSFSDLLGFKILVESKVGQGSCFSIVFADTERSSYE